MYGLLNFTLHTIISAGVGITEMINSRHLEWFEQRNQSKNKLRVLFGFVNGENLDFVLPEVPEVL